MSPTANVPFALMDTQEPFTHIFSAYLDTRPHESSLVPLCLRMGVTGDGTRFGGAATRGARCNEGVMGVRFATHWQTGFHVGTDRLSYKFGKIDSGRQASVGFFRNWGWRNRTTTTGAQRTFQWNFLNLDDVVQNNDLPRCLLDS